MALNKKCISVFINIYVFESCIDCLLEASPSLLAGQPVDFIYKLILTHIIDMYNYQNARCCKYKQKIICKPLLSYMIKLDVATALPGTQERYDIRSIPRTFSAVEKTFLLVLVHLGLRHWILELT